MALMSYLIRDNHGTYYFRRVIPPTLRDFMPEPWVHKSAWKVTLGTKDPHQAKRLGAGKLRACLQDFDLAELKRERGQRVSLSDTEINALAGWYRDESLNEDREFWETEHRADESFFENVRAMFKTQSIKAATAFPKFEGRGLSPRQIQHKAETAAIVSAGMRSAIARGDTSVVEFEVDDVLAIHGISLPRDSVSYRRLALAFLEAQLEAAESLGKRLKGEVVPAPTLSTPRGDGTIGRSDLQAVGPRLREAFDHWKQLQNPGLRSAMEFERAVKLFVEIKGDMPVAAIRRVDATEFRDALQAVPLMKYRTGKLHRASLPRLVQWAKEHPEAERIAAATINKMITGLASICQVSRDDGRLPLDVWENPFRIKKVNDRGERRLPYSASDLQKIFSSSIYTSNQRPPAAAGGVAAYWLPLLALFTGSRQEELAQLLIEDVRDEDGIPYLFILADDGRDRQGETAKNVKIRGKRLRVPLHSELIRCGFLRYVDNRRSEAKPTDRLFPDLKRDSRGRLGGNWSKWYTRWCRRTLGITDRRKVFHSFRHGWKDAARAAGIDAAVSDAITGHSHAGVGSQYGTRGNEGYPLKVLKAAMDRIVLPVDVSKLQWTSERDQVRSGPLTARQD